MMLLPFPFVWPIARGCAAKEQYPPLMLYRFSSSLFARSLSAASSSVVRNKPVTGSFSKSSKNIKHIRQGLSQFQPRLWCKSSFAAFVSLAKQ